jgi:hypothetical protein
LPAALALHLLSQAVRSRGWFNILRLTYPRARGLRARDVMAASFAGAGVNGLVPARAGDLVKLAFVHRRIDGARCATLIGTAVPETAFESLITIALVGWVLAAGLVTVPTVTHPGLVALLGLVLLPAGAAALWRASRARAGVLRHVREGLRAFSSPRRFVTQVASWQALARVARLGSLACFLAAFELPASPAAALLVMSVQGAGRVVPIAALSTGLRIAALSYGLAAVSGRPADPAAVAAFTLGTSGMLLVAMVAIASAVIVRELGTRSPWCAVRRARIRLQDAPVVRPAQRRPMLLPQDEPMLARTFGNADDALGDRLLAVSGGAEA